MDRDTADELAQEILDLNPGDWETAVENGTFGWVVVATFKEGAEHRLHSRAEWNEVRALVYDQEIAEYNPLYNPADDTALIALRESLGGREYAVPPASDWNAADLAEYLAWLGHVAPKLCIPGAMLRVLVLRWLGLGQYPGEVMEDLGLPVHPDYQPAEERA